MEHRDISHLKGKVLCSAVLETAGFAVDLKESTSRAIKFRRGADIIIVIHDGKGWFDPLSEAKGDVLSLIQHLDGASFAEALALAAGLVGFTRRSLDGFDRHGRGKTGWLRPSDGRGAVGPGPARHPGPIFGMSGGFTSRSFVRPRIRTP